MRQLDPRFGDWMIQMDLDCEVDPTEYLLAQMEVGNHHLRNLQSRIQLQNSHIFAEMEGGVPGH
jgi:hypothetical protein